MNHTHNACMIMISTPYSQLERKLRLYFVTTEGNIVFLRTLTDFSRKDEITTGFCMSKP